MYKRNIFKEMKKISEMEISDLGEVGVVRGEEVEGVLSDEEVLLLHHILTDGVTTVNSGADIIRFDIKSS